MEQPLLSYVARLLTKDDTRILLHGPRSVGMLSVARGSPFLGVLVVHSICMYGVVGVYWCYAYWILSYGRSYLVCLCSVLFHEMLAQCLLSHGSCTGVWQQWKYKFDEISVTRRYEWFLPRGDDV